MQNVRFQLIFYSVLSLFVIFLLYVIFISFFGQSNQNEIPENVSPTEFPLNNGSLNRGSRELFVISNSLGNQPIPVTGFFTVLFSTPVNNGKLDIDVSPQIDITPTFDISFKTLTIAPLNSWADGTTYTITLSKKASSTDNQPLKPYQIQFKTEAYAGY